MSCSRNAGVQCTTVPLTLAEIQPAPGRRCGIAEHWSFDFDAMEQAVADSETKIGTFLLCNPHNPVGRVFSKPELEDLVRFCHRHEMTICADEVHSDLVLDEDKDHIPFLGLELEGELGDYARQNTVALYAPSKTYNVAGLAAAVGVIPDNQLRADFKRAADGVMAGISVFGYVGLEACYDGSKETALWRQELLGYLRANMDLLDAYLEKWDPLVKMDHRQEATYLAWLDCTGLEQQVQAKSAAEFFEEHCGVGLNDGATFGPGKEYGKFVRVNVACPRETLREALERIDATIRPFRKSPILGAANPNPHCSALF